MPKRTLKWERNKSNTNISCNNDAAAPAVDDFEFPRISTLLINKIFRYQIMQELVFETAFSFYMHFPLVHIYQMTWLPITVVAHKFAHQKYSAQNFLCSLFSVQILIYYVWRFLYGSMFWRHTHTHHIIMIHFHRVFYSISGSLLGLHIALATNYHHHHHIIHYKNFWRHSRK